MLGSARIMVRKIQRDVLEDEGVTCAMLPSIYQRDLQIRHLRVFSCNEQAVRVLSAHFSHIAMHAHTNHCLRNQSFGLAPSPGLLASWFMVTSPVLSPLPKKITSTVRSSLSVVLALDLTGIVLDSIHTGTSSNRG